MLVKFISLSTDFCSFVLCSLVVDTLVARNKFINLKFWLLRKERSLIQLSRRISVRKRLSWWSLNAIKLMRMAKSVTFVECPTDEWSAGVFMARTLREIIVANVVWSTVSTNMKTSNCKNKILAASVMWTS